MAVLRIDFDVGVVGLGQLTADQIDGIGLVGNFVGLLPVDFEDVVESFHVVAEIFFVVGIVGWFAVHHLTVILII